MLTSYLKRRLSWRLLTSILLFSSIITLIGAALQLYLDYQRDLEYVDDRIESIRITHLGSLTTSLWKLDHPQLATESGNIARMRDVVAVKIHVNGKVAYQAGDEVSPEDRIRTRRFPMIYEDERHRAELGALEVVVSLSGVRQRLFDRVLVILGTQALKTFLVSIFFLFIIHLLVVRHLHVMSAYARVLRIGHLDTEIKLDRPAHPPKQRDELDEVVDAINAMRQNLQQDVAVRETIEAELRRHRDELDALVAQRTAELEKIAIELKNSNQELQSFAYTLSHDLQEPLRMISSYMQLLKRRYKGKLEQDADEFIAYAMDGAKRMSAMIDGLLQYSRVETQGEPFSLHDLDEVLDEALANLRLIIEDSTAEVDKNPLPTLATDASQMQRLFQNLIGNALKFRGDVSPRVRIEAERHGAEWVFSIADNGIGIPPEQAERIFNMFQRLHTREEYPGMGIGLAVCKRIVERHGGRIWVESELGNGCTFFFTLPAEGYGFPEKDLEI